MQTLPHQLVKSHVSILYFPSAWHGIHTAKFLQKTKLIQMGTATAMQAHLQRVVALIIMLSSTPRHKESYEVSFHVLHDQDHAQLEDLQWPA